MRGFWHLAFSLILGFLGGLLAIDVQRRLHSREITTVLRAGTVRAERYELVGPSNMLLAFWGQDLQKQKILIAFVDDKGHARAEFGAEANLFDGRTIRYTPFSALIGSDGGIRVQQRLDNSQEPVLLMGDSKTEARLLLGHRLSEDVASDPWDRWGLSFRDFSDGWIDFAEIGVTTPMDTKRRTGYLVLRSSSGQKFSAPLK